MAGEESLRAESIIKRFGATLALDGVTVSFTRGEVHALMGENGAGKSTLGKTIAGLHRADGGRVLVDGAPLRPGDAGDAFRAGVRIVHQELAQCPNMSVAENICLHDFPRGRLGWVDRRAMRDRASRLIRPLDAGLDVEAPLGSLSPGRRQICQIASALDDGRAGVGGPRVIIFDEPTSSLSVTEADRLLEIIRQLAGRGLTIVYVSHRMGEIFQVCDRVTVLRDGRLVATTPTSQLGEAALVEQMIGRRLEHAPTAHRLRTAGEPLLRVRGLSSPGRLRDVSLEVRAGEVLGVGGLVGAGRSELLDAIFGLDAAARGEVVAGGRTLTPGDPRTAVRAGLGYVPEDRRRQGLFFNLDLLENIVMPRMRELAGVGGVRRRGSERREVAEKMSEYRVKAASTAQQPGALSGGNQQKLLLARWMGRGTRVLLLDEPTRGIDVGTKREVHALVRSAAAAGLAVLLVSSEMPELLALADRVVVMCDGRLTGELSGEAITQGGVLRLATIDSSAARPAPAGSGAT